MFSLRYSLLVVLAVFWCGSIVAYPWIVRLAPDGASLLLAWFFSHLCHQDPIRSFSINGAQLPVCSRCTAIYLGGLVGVAGYPILGFFKRGEGHLTGPAVAAAGLLLANAGLDLVGALPNTFFSRFLTGSLFGVVWGTALALAIHRWPALQVPHLPPSESRR
jgi:uncharacterized membrane protein